VTALKKNTDSLLEASREVGIEVNSEVTKCMFMSCLCHQNVGQNHSSLTANRSFENVTQFKYLETADTNKNCIHE
jgi:hypothetical protein